MSGTKPTDTGEDARLKNPSPFPVRVQLLPGNLASDPAALADLVAAIRADGQAMNKVVERASKDIEADPAPRP